MYIQRPVLVASYLWTPNSFRTTNEVQYLELSPFVTIRALFSDSRWVTSEWQTQAAKLINFLLELFLSDLDNSFASCWLLVSSADARKTAKLLVVLVKTVCLSMQLRWNATLFIASGGSRNFWKWRPRSYKILERRGPKSLKMAFECSFQSFSYKCFANIPPKGEGRGGAGPLP